MSFTKCGFDPGLFPEVLPTFAARVDEPAESPWQVQLVWSLPWQAIANKTIATTIRESTRTNRPLPLIEVFHVAIGPSAHTAMVRRR